MYPGACGLPTKIWRPAVVRRGRSAVAQHEPGSGTHGRVPAPGGCRRSGRPEDRVDERSIHVFLDGDDLPTADRDYLATGVVVGNTVDGLCCPGRLGDHAVTFCGLPFDLQCKTRFHVTTRPGLIEVEDDLLVFSNSHFVSTQYSISCSGVHSRILW